MSIHSYLCPALVSSNNQYTVYVVLSYQWHNVYKPLIKKNSKNFNCLVTFILRETIMFRRTYSIFYYTFDLLLLVLKHFICYCDNNANDISLCYYNSES